MSKLDTSEMPPSVQELRGAAAIVGVGETDYHLDYKAARAKPPGYAAPTAESLAQTAFERALADSGLARQDIDGLSVSFLYGGPNAAELAPALGLQPRRLFESGGIMTDPLPIVSAAIAASECDTVAMVYAVASRSLGLKYGGYRFAGGGAPTSYYYYHPWGWSSQAAHWAFIWSRYQATYNASETDLGAVAVQLRKNAITNPNSVMQTPLSIADYLASRYIVQPLRLLDLCLVNDGGVCLIVRRTDKARDLPHTPVQVEGWGKAKVTSDKLHALVRERLQPQIRRAGEEAFAMAGVGLSEIQHFEGYDASTIHLINQVEGYGFVEPGAGLEFCKSGAMAVSGALPVNVAGGMLSGSYMHGWSHIAEITRQLRREAGVRQIADVEVSMFSLAETDQVHSLVFRRGG